MSGGYLKAVCLIFLLSILWVTSVSSADQIVKITYLKGDVFTGKTVDGPWEDVKIDMNVEVGRFIKTSSNSYVEFKLFDNSVMRLSPNAVFHIEKAEFIPKRSRLFLARLILGKFWAKVDRVFGRNSKDSFKTRTGTMVCGVRGTVYDLRALADGSTDIWVYEGRVAVGPPLVKEDAAHQEIQWPRQVSENEWEEIILGKLQKLHIGPDGKPDMPVTFDPSKEKDVWAAWNLERDALGD